MENDAANSKDNRLGRQIEAVQCIEMAESKYLLLFRQHYLVSFL